MNPPVAAANLVSGRSGVFASLASGLAVWDRTTGKTWVRVTALFLYYLAIIGALLVIYGRGDFKTAPFVYQGF